jgi:hypothetical protein
VAGLFAALMVSSNGIAQLGFRRHSSVISLRVAMAVMVGGMGLIALSSSASSLAVALVGAVVAGAGAGVVQLDTMGTIQRIAPAHARGGVTSAFLMACYLAMSVPVVIAGLSADRFGLARVTGWYLAGLAVLVTGALVASFRTAGSGDAVEELALDEMVIAPAMAEEEAGEEAATEPGAVACLAGA